MKITDISDLVKDSEFGVFSDPVKAGGSVRGIVAKNAAATLTRKEVDKLIEFVRGIGAKGLAYVRWIDDTPTCSFGKFMRDGELESICNSLGCAKGDVALISADSDKVVLPILGALRKHVAEKLDIIPDGYNYVWITDMPFFDKDDDGNFVAMHHPFTCPTDESLQYIETAKDKVYAKAYDLVINGVELLSGSIRINDYELQEKMFKALGLSEKEIELKFGFLVEAYRYAAPPHGGAGFGLDRLAMVLCGADNLRDVTAFPKIKDASELMSDCPAEVGSEQLTELGIVIKENNK